MKYIPRRCEVCGRFIADDDPYGDFHMAFKHPVEHSNRMEEYRQRLIREREVRENEMKLKHANI